MISGLIQDVRYAGRMALGAQPRRVVRLIVSKGMSVGLIGIGVGLLGALVVTRPMASLVYGVPLHDGATFVGVAIILTTLALVAYFISGAPRGQG